MENQKYKEACLSLLNDITDTISNSEKCMYLAKNTEFSEMFGFIIAKLRLARQHAEKLITED